MKTLVSATKLQIFESLCDSLQDSVLLFNSDGVVFHANERFREATGTSLSNLVGTSVGELGDFVTEEALTVFERNLDLVLAGETPERRVELQGFSPLEGHVTVEARITSFETDELEGAGVVLRDLSEKVDAMEALTLKSEQLAVINAVLRHDIRNDMSVMLGWAEQLEPGLETEEDRRILDRFLRHGTHIVELTYAARELMEAIEAEWEMDLQPVPLRETVVREAELVSEQFPEAELELVDSLPDVSVRANEFLSSVIENILTNAIRHNDAETPRVEIDVGDDDDRASIAIADNGPGIPDAQKAAIYEIGEKGPESSGTGLGLYLVKSLVDAYGGAVSIADREPHGTVVTVELEQAN